MTHPDRERCYEYLKEYETPQHVVGHCKSVAAVSYILAKALNEAGGTKALRFEDVKFNLIKSEASNREHYYQDNAAIVEDGVYRMFNLDLILASGLLHDMARVYDRHWDVAADFCHKMALYQEEKIVRIHMQYEFCNDVDHLTEADIVCLGDRLSLEDKYAGLDERMDYIIKKAIRNGHPEAEKIILPKKEIARKLLNDIEKRVGKRIDELMINIDYENIEGICNDNR